VRGWAVDDGYDGPITVALYVDGHFWLRVTADPERPDLVEQGWGRTGSPSPTPSAGPAGGGVGVRGPLGRLPRPAAVAAAGLALTTPDGYLAPGGPVTVAGS
jgi:hypothetical protein